MTEQNKARAWEVILLAASIVGVGYLAWRISVGQHMAAAAERDAMRQEFARELRVMSSVYGKRIVKSERSAWVAADADGIVTDMNAVARKELALEIGDHIEDCMHEEDRHGHHERYLVAMAEHANGSPSEGSSVGEVLGPDGEWYRAKVERWTVLSGSESFITRE